MTEHTAAELIAKGYRRTSNKYRMVSRIDRADWLTVLAVHCRRAPADFYEIGAENPSGNWCGFYRRVLSKDTIEGLDPEVFKEIPSSDWDDCGFCE